MGRLELCDRLGRFPHDVVFTAQECPTAAAALGSCVRRANSLEGVWDTQQFPSNRFITFPPEITSAPGDIKSLAASPSLIPLLTPSRSPSPNRRPLDQSTHPTRVHFKPPA